MADPQLAFWVLLLTIFTIMALGLKMGGYGLELGGGGGGGSLAGKVIPGDPACFS